MGTFLDENCNPDWKFLHFPHFCERVEKEGVNPRSLIESYCIEKGKVSSSGKVFALISEDCEVWTGHWAGHWWSIGEYYLFLKWIKERGF